MRSELSNFFPINWSWMLLERCITHELIHHRFLFICQRHLRWRGAITSPASNGSRYEKYATILNLWIAFFRANRQYFRLPVNYHIKSFLCQIISSRRKMVWGVRKKKKVIRFQEFSKTPHLMRKNSHLLTVSVHSTSGEFFFEQQSAAVTGCHFFFLLNTWSNHVHLKCKYSAVRGESE